jgi:hypothetical protein
MEIDKSQSNYCFFEQNHFGFMQKRIIQELLSVKVINHADESKPILQDAILSPEIPYR